MKTRTHGSTHKRAVRCMPPNAKVGAQSKQKQKGDVKTGKRRRRDRERGRGRGRASRARDLQHAPNKFDLSLPAPARPYSPDSKSLSTQPSLQAPCQHPQFRSHLPTKFVYLYDVKLMAIDVELVADRHIVEPIVYHSSGPANRIWFQDTTTLEEFS